MPESLDRAVDRLKNVICEEPDKKIVFVIGAGLSVPVIPTTEDIAHLFCDAMGDYGPTHRLKMASMSIGEAYRTAAEELRGRRGDDGIAKAIRKAVEKAYRGPRGSGEFPLTEKDWIGLPENWCISPAQEALARVISHIPSHRRGPLFTTNFDPLTELALSKYGVPNATISAYQHHALPFDSIFGVLPVVYLHGFWTKGPTLSAPTQLMLERPGIEDTIQTQMSNAIIVVVGYGGWNDSFTRALRASVENGKLALFGGDILWMSYGEQSTSMPDGLPRVFEGRPNVNNYWGIDAATLFESVESGLKAMPRTSSYAFPGWLTVTPALGHGMATQDDLRSYAEGTHPTWESVARSPSLSSAKALDTQVQTVLDSKKDRIVSILGPAGEGKTSALMQCALKISSLEYPPLVLFREPGSGAITREWITFLRKSAPLTVLIVDEADLFLPELGALRAEGPGVIVVVAALHDHYRNVLSNRAKVESLDLDVLELGRLGLSDYQSIAEFWHKNRLIPQEYLDEGVDAIADMIKAAGESLHGPSFFGALLQLWSGPELFDRVYDLLDRLSSTTIMKQNFRTILGAIAMVQIAWDPEEDRGLGIPESVLAEICGIHSSDVWELLVAPLGREVGIARVGDRVYVRHPAVASAIVEALREDDLSVDLAYTIGRAAGVRKLANDRAVRSSFALSKKLDGAEAVSAAQGALTGALTLLEPRVSFLSALRRNEQIDFALSYGDGVLKHLNTYTDRNASLRGLYVERAMLEERLGHLSNAIGYCSASLSDLGCFPITGDQLRYGLVNTVRFSRRLAGAGNRDAAALDRSGSWLARLVPGADEYLPIREEVEVLSLFEALRLFRLHSESFSGAVRIKSPWTFQDLRTAVGKYIGLN